MRDRPRQLERQGGPWLERRLGADTFAGPAYLGVGFGKDNAWSFYLMLGAP